MHGQQNIKKVDILLTSEGSEGHKIKLCCRHYAVRDGVGVGGISIVLLQACNQQQRQAMQ